jgi:two-component system cell cycle response regulator DivK
MDIKIPVRDGYEATKIIKEINPKIIVITVTDYGLAGDKDKILAAGCDYYIAKPYEPIDLIEKLRKYL